MRRQAVVGISEVPDVIHHDEHPSHVRPDHVLLVLGRIDIPPCGHTEDVEQTGKSVEYVVPAAIQPNTFARQPPFVPTADSGLEIRADSDKDVDSHDDERERLEPALGTDTPLVLNHHETDTAGQGSIQFRIVEPTVHVHMRLVVQRPVGPHTCTYRDGNEIDRQCQRNSKECDGSTEFGTPRKLIPQNQSCKDHKKHNPLNQSVLSINLKKHKLVILKD